MDIVRREVVAQAFDVRPQPDQVPSFDASLVRVGWRDYRLEVHMRLEFTFSDNGDDVWRHREQTDFVRRFESQVKAAWDGVMIGQTQSSEPVELELKFSHRPGPVPNGLLSWLGGPPHFSIDVSKAGRQSSVDRQTGQVFLDMQDLEPEGEPDGNAQQPSTVVCLFGEMLGIADDCPAAAGDASKPLGPDRGNAANAGSRNRRRHLATLKDILGNLIMTRRARLVAR